MNKTIATINRELECATQRQQLEFFYYLMGWLETAEAQQTIHQNTIVGCEYAARLSIRRHQQQEDV